MSQLRTWPKFKSQILWSLFLGKVSQGTTLTLSRTSESSSPKIYTISSRIGQLRSSSFKYSSVVWVIRHKLKSGSNWAVTPSRKGSRMNISLKPLSRLNNISWLTVAFLQLESKKCLKSDLKEKSSSLMSWRNKDSKRQKSKKGPTSRNKGIWARSESKMVPKELIILLPKRLQTPKTCSVSQKVKAREIKYKTLII